MPRPSSEDRQIAYTYVNQAAPHLFRLSMEMTDMQIRTWRDIAEISAIGDQLRDERHAERPTLTLIEGGRDD